MSYTPALTFTGPPAPVERQAEAMANKNPQESLQKWERRTTSAAPDFKKGVERVTESPTAKAAQRVDKALAGFQEAVTSGRMAAQLNAVTLGDWKTQTMQKGGANFATGVANVSQRKKNNMVENFQVVEAVATEVRAMPDNTLEERIQRSIAMIRGMHASKRQG